MILTTLFAMMLLVQEPAAPPPAVQPAVSAEDAAIFTRIDSLMAAWKGKSGDPLRGRLGLSSATKTASDGTVVFWRSLEEATACGVDSAGRMSCGVIGGNECLLGVAFEKDGKVKSWRASGAASACQKFADTIGAP